MLAIVGQQPSSKINAKDEDTRSVTAEAKLKQAAACAGVQEKKKKNAYSVELHVDLTLQRYGTLDV